VWRALPQPGAMVEVDDAASDLPPDRVGADPPALAGVDGGARWHPSSPRVSPRITPALPGTLVPREALVIDCVMGLTTSAPDEIGTW
jgi:hypothetical protein